MISKQPKNDLVNPPGQIVNRPPLQERLKRIPEPVVSKKEQWQAVLFRAAKNAVTPTEALVLNEIKMWLEQNT